MKKLTLRLLVLILSVYVAGSICPLLAHEPCHAPAPAPAPAPPPAPTPAPAAPPMLDAKAGPPPVLPLTPTPTSIGGCGGASQPTPPQPMVAETPPATGKPESTPAPSTTTSSDKVPSSVPPTHVSDKVPSSVPPTRVEEVPTGTRYIPGVLLGAPPILSPTPASSGTSKKPGVGTPPTSVPPTAASAGGPIDYDAPPTNPDGVCYDHVSEKINGPKPKARKFLTKPEFTKFLETENNNKAKGKFREVPEKSVGSLKNKTDLPEKTIIQLPGHVAIVGADGKLHHYLQDRPHIKEQRLQNKTIQELMDMKAPNLDYLGKPVLNKEGKPTFRQPFKDKKIRIWIPTGK